MTFSELFALVDRQVAERRYPGAVVAVRHAGTTTVHATGTLAVGGGEPVTPATPFRVASVSKPFGGLLALTLVADGTLALDDDVARWLPELAAPRCCGSPAPSWPTPCRPISRSPCGTCCR